MKTFVGLVTLCLLSCAVAFSALGQGVAPRHSAKKRLPIPILKAALEKLEGLETSLEGEKKLGGKKLDGLRLDIKEVKLQLREFLLDIENNKVMLPAYECCPCPAGTMEAVNSNADETAQSGQPQPVETKAVAIDDATFSSLIVALKEQGFADDRLTVLKQASASQYYSVAQVKEILAQFSFPDDKLAALRIIRERITDKENSFQIYGSFVHSSDKDEAKKILEEGE